MKTQILVCLSRFFGSGIELDNWRNFELPAYSEDVSIYVSDFRDSNLPSRKVISVGDSPIAGVSSTTPDNGDLCLYNYSAYYESDGVEEWICTEYETLYMDGLIITYDRNSAPVLERIENYVDSSLPAYHVSVNSPTFIEFITEDEIKIAGGAGSSVASRPVELEEAFYIHDQGSYRIDITVDTGVDVIFEEA